MPTKPPARNWRQGSTGVITDAATPAPKVGYLTEAVTIPLAAALGPYCGCAKLFDGCTSGLSGRYFGVMLAPKARRGRVGYSKAGTTPFGGTIVKVTGWSTVGGTTGDDVVTSNPPWVPVEGMPGNGQFGLWAQTFGFSYATAMIWETGDADEATPTWPMDRQFEVTTQSTPYVEPCYIANVAGAAFWVSGQQGDIE